MSPLASTLTAEEVRALLQQEEGQYLGFKSLRNCSGTPSRPSFSKARAFPEACIPKFCRFFDPHRLLKNADYRALCNLVRPVEERFLPLEGERRGAHYLPQPNLEGVQK